MSHPATTEIYTLSLHDALPISAAMETTPNVVSPPATAAAAGAPPLYGTCTSFTPVAMASHSPARWFGLPFPDRKSTRLNSSHGYISYAVFCLKKKKAELIDARE